MKPSVLLGQMRREARGSGARLLFFVLCLAVGVGAVVSVTSFSEGLEDGIRREARSLLAADLSIRSRRPIDDAFRQAVDAIEGSDRVEILEMLTVVALPTDDGESPADARPASRSQLTEVKAVDGAYPFYGDLELEPAARLADVLDEASAVVGPELLRRLDLEIGDPVRIGGQEFRIAATVLDEPDRVGGAFSMGPRVFLSRAGLERAGLEQYGSRILYRILVRLPPQTDARLAALADELDAAMPEGSRHRIETYREAQPSLRQGLDRMESYLGLAALLSLLIGGVGVAQTVRTWLAGRMDAIAVLKCLGYRPREILWLYLGQTAALGLLSSLVGVVLGVGLLLVPTTALAGVLPVEQLEPIQPLAWLQGLLLGTGVAVLFALPPLVEAQKVPPIRVLRRSAEPLPASRWARMGRGVVLLAGVFVLAWWQSRSAVRGAAFTAGLVALVALLGAAAVALTRLAARPRRRVPPWLRQGLAAIARRGGSGGGSGAAAGSSGAVAANASTLGAIIALGIGVLVVFAMFLVERGLSAELDRDLPDAAPTAFMIDIQPDQWPRVEDTLERMGAASVDSVPVVMARITAVDDRPVADMVAEREAQAEGDRERDPDDETWALRREQRLTYLEALPEDNQVVDGALWTRSDLPEVSVEKEFAESLDVGVGSVLDFDIQGVPLRLHVTSLRTVDWSTFGINFFLVVEPGVLEEAPQFRIAAARLDDAASRAVQDELAVAFPNITMIQIREVLEKISAILDRLGLGVRVLGGLTVLVGLAILAGAVSASSVRRGNEVALLKTLGMTRRQVVAAFATEYALVGLVAGLIGTLGAGALAWAVLTRAMEVEWTARFAWFPAAILGSIVLSVAAGLLASVGPLSKRPAEALRSAAE